VNLRNLVEKRKDWAAIPQKPRDFQDRAIGQTAANLQGEIKRNGELSGIARG
jgi:hypothetical protein